MALDTISLTDLLRYWRASLADSDRMDIPLPREEDRLKVSRRELYEGLLNHEITQEIFRRDRRIRKRKRASSNLEEDRTKVSLLFAPFLFRIVKSHRQDNQRFPGHFVPLWIPVTLHETGALYPPSEGDAWIPRSLLEPLIGQYIGPTIGTVSSLDLFLTNTPQASTTTWRNYLDRAIAMLKSTESFAASEDKISGSTIAYDEAEYFEIGKPFVVLDTSIRLKASHILKLYDSLLRDKATTSLLSRISALTDYPPRPLIKDLRKEAFSHKGQMSSAFPLSASQRESLLHFLKMEKGDVLTVNGPPGTGKTTLIQSVVANLFVQHAEAALPPPLIVVSSTNNQAVTNVIVSMASHEEDDSLLDRRWIKGIESYGLYCRSSSRECPAEISHSIEASQPQTHVPCQQESECALLKSEFLTSCSSFFGSSVPTVSSAVKRIHEELLHTLDLARQGRECALRLEEQRHHPLYPEGPKQLRQMLISKRKKRETLYAEKDIAVALKQAWLAFLSAKPWWTILFGWLPPVRKHLRLRALLFLEQQGITFRSLQHESDVLLFIEEELKLNQAALNQVEEELRVLKSQRAALIKAKQHWHAWRDTASFKPRTFSEDALDVGLRYHAFKLATHYYEGIWLLKILDESDELQADQSSSRDHDWSLHACLTPCLVTTLHMLPRFFTKGYEAVPSYEVIDLLILDEAGQISPEVAIPSFALAKKALVVGDVCQLEPVWNLTRPVDAGNARRYLTITSQEEFDEFTSTGMSASSGVILKMAQRQSIFQKYSDPVARGMFLSEHRRCVPRIIAYCNELAYSNRLEPLREPHGEDFPLPPIGYAYVPGLSERRGSSRVNQLEARIIAGWIVDRQEFFKKLYPHLPLSKIVAVVTPFSLQSRLIERELAHYGLEDLTVGTVHVLQGAQRKVILFSSVYGEDDSSFFFDRGPNMLNVAVSRAEDSFLVFGDMHIFRSHASQRPSIRLAPYLFSSEGNEITDIRYESPLPPSEDVTTRSIDTLEEHRQELLRSFLRARRQVTICSPFLSQHAIAADRVGLAVQGAVKRDIKVMIFYDPELSCRLGSGEASTREAVRILEASGAQVIPADRIHMKSLSVDSNFLIEGSFNWLSASRDLNLARGERSVILQGEGVRERIGRLLMRLSRGQAAENYQ